jgi:hypothetical protein
MEDPAIGEPLLPPSSTCFSVPLHDRGKIIILFSVMEPASKLIQFFFLFHFIQEPASKFIMEPAAASGAEITIPFHFCSW